MKKPFLLIFIFTFTLFFSQEGYGIITSKTDGYIDIINGERTYESYYEVDFDTNKILNKTDINRQIYINFKRLYSSGVGNGMITFYYGDNSVKLPFDEVIIKNKIFHFFNKEVLFAYYYSDTKTILLIDKTKRVYKSFQDLD